MSDLELRGESGAPDQGLCRRLIHVASSFVSFSWRILWNGATKAIIVAHQLYLLRFVHLAKSSRSSVVVVVTTAAAADPVTPPR